MRSRKVRSAIRCEGARPLVHRLACVPMSFVIASLIWGAVMASASACLPTCTDSSASLHVELLDGSGELCTLRKRAASSCRFIQSAEPRCALDWLSPAQLLRSIKKQGHRWLLFIGDSDTRGVVLGLLQLLAAAGHTSDVAERSRELWLGDAADSSRLCHLDWSYDERDRVLASRAVPCLGQHKPTFSSAFDAINSNLGYIMFGENYTLPLAARTCAAAPSHSPSPPRHAPRLNPRRRCTHL